MPGRPTPIRATVLCALALCAAAAHAADTQNQPTWLTTPGGDYVVHLSAQVAWKRCLEGMRWTGQRCEGRPLRLTHADAVALARSRSKTDGVAWRLPGVKELQRLAQHNTHQPRAEAPLIPVGDEEWCWSSTMTIDTSQVNDYSYGNVMRGVNGQNMARMHFLHAWSVNMESAQLRSDTPRRELLYVRLVRPVD